MSVRLAAAAVLLAVLAGGLAWVVSLAPEAAPSEGEFPTVVVGPDGRLLANGTVRARGTPLEAVQALAARDGFAVEVEDQPWVGTGCTARYVVGIAGVRETSTGGWNYYVRAPGGAWEWKPAGAACHALRPGDQVEWCWVELDACRHHAP